jgi:hypothetical protein
MRKQDLKVGEEYAAGSSSRSDRWRMSRVRVVELDGERPRQSGAAHRGIVVALAADSDRYAWPVWTRGKAGDERVIDSARDIQMSWADYERAKAEFDARQAAARSEQDRAMAVSERASERLTALGATYARSGSDFRFTADDMAALLAVLPDGR